MCDYTTKFRLIFKTDYFARAECVMTLIKIVRSEQAPRTDEYVNIELQCGRGFAKTIFRDLDFAETNYQLPPPPPLPPPPDEPPPPLPPPLPLRLGDDDKELVAKELKLVIV